MLAVTERAKKELKRIISAKINNPQESLRLMASNPSGQFALSIDSELPGDQVVKYKGSKVLLVGQVLAQQIAGRTLDTGDSPDGIKLVVHKEKSRPMP
jgi:hypothetical protein